MKGKMLKPWIFKFLKKMLGSVFIIDCKLLSLSNIFDIFSNVYSHSTKFLLLIHDFVDGLQNLLQKIFVELLYYELPIVFAFVPVA